jgi:hypothetical protein
MSRTIGCAILVAMALAGGAAIAQQAPAGTPATGNSPAAKAPASKPAASKPAASKPAPQKTGTQSEQPERSQGSGAARGQLDSQLRKNMAVLVSIMPAYMVRDVNGVPAKLHNAQIAGPLEYVPLWGDKQTYYCVRADVDRAARLFSGTKTTVVTVEHRDGKVRMRARAAQISMAGPQCGSDGYRPFPELDEVGSKPRQLIRRQKG